MKTILNKNLSLLFVLLLGLSWHSYSQVIDRAERKVKWRKQQKEDEAIDKGLDAIEGLFKKKNKKKDKNEREEESTGDRSDPQAQENKPTSSEESPDNSEQAIAANPPADVWAERYDFKPGPDIIFFDDFEAEEPGEIPSKWHYDKGMLEVARVAGYGNVMSGDLYTHPNWPEGFVLPEQYTIEFDAYMFGGTHSGSYGYNLYFKENSYRENVATLETAKGYLGLHNIAGGPIPGVEKGVFDNQWVHVSISVNGNSIKGYYNQYRTFNARFPNGKKANLFTLWNCCLPADKPHIFMIDNVKIAEGAHPKYKEVLLDGKIVTHNILFDYNSANLLPRSFAEIKRIAVLLESDPSLSFQIEGHTDSEGSDTYNQDLSQKRADSVKKALVDMGIDSSRLKPVGKGEEIPMAPNNTPEGRAMNRRVEFIVL